MSGENLISYFPKRFYSDDMKEKNLIYREWRFEELDDFIKIIMKRLRTRFT